MTILSNLGLYELRFRLAHSRAVVVQWKRSRIEEQAHDQKWEGKRKKVFSCEVRQRDIFLYGAGILTRNGALVLRHLHQHRYHLGELRFDTRS